MLLSGSLSTSTAQSGSLSYTIVVLDPTPNSHWKQNQSIRFRARIERDGNIVRSPESHIAVVVKFPHGMDGKEVKEHLHLYDDGEPSHGDEVADDGTRNNLLTPKAPGECIVFWKAEVNGKDYYLQPKQYTITVEPAPVEPTPPATAPTPPKEKHPSQPPVTPGNPPEPPRPPEPKGPSTPWWVWCAIGVGLLGAMVAALRMIGPRGKILPPLEVIATVLHTGTNETRDVNYVFGECRAKESSLPQATIGSSSISDFVLDDESVKDTHAVIERSGHALFLRPTEDAEVTGPDGEGVAERVSLAMAQEYNIGAFRVSFRWEEFAQPAEQELDQEESGPPTDAEGDTTEEAK